MERSLGVFRRCRFSRQCAWTAGFALAPRRRFVVYFAASARLRTLGPPLCQPVRRYQGGEGFPLAIDPWRRQFLLPVFWFALQSCPWPDSAPLIAQTIPRTEFPMPNCHCRGAFRRTRPPLNRVTHEGTVPSDFPSARSSPTSPSSGLKMPSHGPAATSSSRHDNY